MHLIEKVKWPKIFLLVGLISIALAILVVPGVRAQSTTPTANCNASRTSCTVSFPYSGDYYIWTPPADVRTMSVVLAGAQGGRSGGNGSKTQGTFRSVPTTPLYIYVGGQGSSGNGAAGGYNGGGQAGFGHGDEGSGGGATDIRTSTLLADRIAVAGGGGGTGGWVGGTGGSAGGVNGGAGASGQGAGGGGGTALVGGAGGSSNGAATTPGTSGAAGQGGQGGSANTPGSTVAGGGGGGGGYFGGGGGGADTEASGLDGGGGGAGSSYMNSTKLQSITYYSAFQAGDGLATITYNFGPSVTSFTTPVSPSKAQTPVFNLTFGQSVTGLTADDFTFTGTSTSCYVSQVTGSGATYAITVSGCTDGTVALSLKADSVFGNAIGPVRAVATSTITLDRTLPEINSLTKQPSSNDLVIYKAVFTEAVTGLVADSTDWLVKGNGCSIQSMTGSANEYVITISGCLDGNLAGLVLNSLAVSDSAGNIGPSLSNQTPVTKIDTTAPKFAVFDVTAPGVGGTPSWVFDSEEPVNGMSAAKFVFSGTATGCQLNYTVLRTGLGWQITLNNCSIGTAQVTLVANAVSDNANNLGPTTALASNQLTITPDEVVNQSVNPPSGNQGAAVSDKPKKIVDKVEPIPQVELEPEPTIMVEPIDPNLPEVEKPMTTKDKPEAVIEPTAYPFGLFGLALILAVLALGTGRRKVRRRH
ncbi:MAG: glycine-rich protein [Rhodoluna sp.]